VSQLIDLSTCHQESVVDILGIKIKLNLRQLLRNLFVFFFMN